MIDCIVTSLVVGLCAAAFFDMVSYRRLLAAVEAALLGPKPAPHHRADLSHALHVCLPEFYSFLKYPVPGFLSALPSDSLPLDSSEKEVLPSGVPSAVCRI